MQSTSVLDADYFKNPLQASEKMSKVLKMTVENVKPKVYTYCNGDAYLPHYIFEQDPTKATEILPIYIKFLLVQLKSYRQTQKKPQLIILLNCDV